MDVVTTFGYLLSRDIHVDAYLGTSAGYSVINANIACRTTRFVTGADTATGNVISPIQAKISQVWRRLLDSWKVPLRL